MRWRLPNLRPQVHTGLGYGVADVGRACVNKTFGCITTVIIIGVLLYLFYTNPPWFQEIREGVSNYFKGRG